MCMGINEIRDFEGAEFFNAEMNIFSYTPVRCKFPGLTFLQATHICTYEHV